MPLPKTSSGREADGPEILLGKNGRTNQEGEGGGRALAYMTPLLTADCQLNNRKCLET